MERTIIKADLLTIQSGIVRLQIWLDIMATSRLRHWKYLYNKKIKYILMFNGWRMSKKEVFSAHVEFEEQKGRLNSEFNWCVDI